ncbi:MAG TPA: hypothetical protein VGA17_11535 [Nitrospiraceae bacterium]|jgi:hypothetical protein
MNGNLRDIIATTIRYRSRRYNYTLPNAVVLERTLSAVEALGEDASVGAAIEVMANTLNTYEILCYDSYYWTGRPTSMTMRARA